MTANIVLEAIKNNEPYIYFHTHKVTETLLHRAIISNKSIELDVSFDEKIGPIIGHPLAFYKYRGIQKPESLPFHDAIKKLTSTKIVVVLDCKDVRALPYLETVALELGRHRVLLHAWVDSLSFKPYADDVVVEPHWDTENMPEHHLRSFYNKTGVPVVLSCRGLTLNNMSTNKDKFYETLKNLTDFCVAVNPNLSPSSSLPAELIEMISKLGMVPWINVITTSVPDGLTVYIGASDDLNDCSMSSD